MKRIIEEKEVGRSSFSQIFAPIAAGSLILSDGELWKKQRRMLAPFFFTPKVGADKIKQIAAGVLGEWEEAADSKKPVDGKQAVIVYCMKVLAEIVFGSKYNDSKLLDDIYINWNVALTCFTKTMGGVATKDDEKQMESACLKVENIILNIIQEKKAIQDFGVDILSGLLNQDTESAMNDMEIMKNIKGLFMAGFETISGALAWFLADLAQNLKWQEKLRKEILQNSLEVNEDNGVMKQCFDESLRLHPPLVFIDRLLRTEVNIEDYVLPANSEVLICPYIIHRDPRYWSIETAYIPNRKETLMYSKCNTYEYFPYGGGPMKCMGEKISIIERNILLSEILSKYEIRIYQDKEVEEDNALVLRPKELKLTLSKIGEENE